MLEKSDPWEEKYRLAKDYYVEHGDLDIPKDYSVGEFSLENGYVSRKVSIEQGQCRKDILSDYLILAWSGIMWLIKMLRIHI